MTGTTYGDSQFFIQLAGTTMLLLFAVRMVQTGIERSVSATFKRALTSQKSLIGAAGAGIGLAVALQSSAAVALLVAGFSSGGTLGLNTGLAIVLGGDLGSAIIIQVLGFRLDWLIPLLLTVGGWMFVKSGGARLRQYGRIPMGIAFIMISLQFLREAMAPIRESAFLPALSDYLARDYLTAFIVGAALAFVVHSSIKRELLRMAEFAIYLERAGDTISKRLLVVGESEVSRLERRSSKHHLKRLAKYGVKSIESSNTHLETLRGLFDFSNQIAAIAYPILYRSGQLLETRLIENIDEYKS